MKIYFNRRPVFGPWGGGSKILSAIINACTSKGHEVYAEEEIFSTKGIDVLVCVDPRPNQFVNFVDLINYKNTNNSKLIQRVGDLGTHGKPELLRIIEQTTNFADAIIFPSNWAANKFNRHLEKIEIIANAPLKNFFCEEPRPPINKVPKIISHHWSNNAMKGFDIYEKLDKFCKQTGSAEFTYIGRAPNELSLTNHIQPLDVNDLAIEIKKHDIYITASKYEAGANHVLEAIAVGLPVLYHREGGSINEYCGSRGIAYGSFEELVNVLENKLEEIKKIANEKPIKRTADDMAEDYVAVFEKINSI
jgi:glycosyltransferase involved in cell wall biosynthesis